MEAYKCIWFTIVYYQVVAILTPSGVKVDLNHKIGTFIQIYFNLHVEVQIGKMIMFQNL